MTNQNFSTLSNFPNFDFPKVIAFLQPPYDHNKDSLKVKEDITVFCQKNNFNLLEAIDFEDPCDHEALNKLIDLVGCNASDHPIKLMINEEMVATPNNVPFWSAIGVLVGLKLITVTAYDYDYWDHNGIFLDESYLRKLDFIDVATDYFKNHYLFKPIKTNNTFTVRPSPKPILFLQPPYTDESLELKAKLKAYCKNKNYGKLKTLRYQTPYDFTSLYALVHEVKINKAKPARILIDQEIIHKPIHKILWIMLDTLLIEEVVEIYVYVQEGGTLYIRRLKESEDRLLSTAIAYDKLLNSSNKEMLSTKEYVQETARYYDWKEVKGSEVNSGTVE